jgi:hypothetical protein
MSKKTTVYLDPRGPAQEQIEEIEKELEIAEKEKSVETVNNILTGLLTYLVILPFLFMFAFNVSLTKVFDLGKIGYVESLGIVIVARILRGKKTND